MLCERCKIEGSLDKCALTVIDGVEIKIVKCSNCFQCTCIEMLDGWKPIKYFLNRTTNTHGIHPVVTIEDKIVHYLLRQLCNSENKSCEDVQLLFDVPDISDIIMLFWSYGNVVGFFSLKPKGTWIEKVNEVYTLTTLDTIYICKEYRGHGFSQEMMEYICKSYNGEDIGISKPISPAMKGALMKFLIFHPEYRNRLWEIDGTGGEGYRKLVWFVLKAEAKSRCS